MMRVSPKAAAIIRRWVSVVGIAAVVGLIGAFTIAVTQQTTYSGRAVVAVPVFDLNVDESSESAVDNPALGRPLDASRLARTYASLIVEDFAIYNAVADETGRSVDELTEAISVENTPDTTLIEIVVTGPDEAMVAATLTSFVDALSGPVPASPSIAPGSLQEVRVEDPVASASTGLLPALPAGFAIGLAVSIVLAIFWERSKPRLDVAAEVAKLLGLRTRDVGNLVDGSGTWVMKRWAELAGAGGWVVIIACAPVQLSSITAAVRKLAESLDVATVATVAPTGFAPPSVPRADQPAEVRADTDDHFDEADPAPELVVTVPYAGDGNAPGRLVLTASHPPGHPDGFEPETDRPGLVVVAVARGTAASAVIETVDALVAVGMVPGYAILLD